MGNSNTYLDKKKKEELCGVSVGRVNKYQHQKDVLCPLWEGEGKQVEGGKTHPFSWCFLRKHNTTQPTRRSVRSSGAQRDIKYSFSLSHLGIYLYMYNISFHLGISSYLSYWYIV